MKLTKTKLKQLIKEELHNVLHEQDRRPRRGPEPTHGVRRRVAHGHEDNYSVVEIVGPITLPKRWRDTARPKGERPRPRYFIYVLDSPKKTAQSCYSAANMPKSIDANARRRILKCVFELSGWNMSVPHADQFNLKHVQRIIEDFPNFSADKLGEIRYINPLASKSRKVKWSIGGTDKNIWKRQLAKMFNELAPAAKPPAAKHAQSQGGVGTGDFAGIPAPPKR